MFSSLPSLLMVFLATAGTGRCGNVSSASPTPPGSDPCPYGPDINENFKCRAWERAGKYQHLGMPIPGALQNLGELCEEEMREFYSIWDRVRPTGTRYNATPPSSTRCQSVIPDPYSSPVFQCDGLKRVRRYQEIGISEPEAVDIVDALCNEEQRKHSVENLWRKRLRMRKDYFGWEPVSFKQDIYPPFQCLALERVRGMPVPEHPRDIDAVCREEHRKFLAEPGWHYTWPYYRCGAWERVRKYEQLGFPVPDALRDIPARCAEERDEYDAIMKRSRQKEENVPFSRPVHPPYFDDPRTKPRISNASTSHSPSISTTTPLSSSSSSSSTSSTPTSARSIGEIYSECRRKFGVPRGQSLSHEIRPQVVQCVHENVSTSSSSSSSAISPALPSNNQDDDDTYSQDFHKCFRILDYSRRRRINPDRRATIDKCVEELRKARANEVINEGASTVTPSSTHSSSSLPAPTPDEQGAHRTYSNHVLSCLAKLAVDYRKPTPPDVLLKVNQCLEQSQQADEDKKETDEETISVALSPSPTPTSPPDADITGKPTTPEPGHKTPPAPLTPH